MQHKEEQLKAQASQQAVAQSAAYPCAAELVRKQKQDKQEAQW